MALKGSKHSKGGVVDNSRAHMLCRFQRHESRHEDALSAFPYSREIDGDCEQRMEGEKGHNTSEQHGVGVCLRSAWMSSAGISRRRVRNRVVPHKRRDSPFGGQGQG